MRFVVIDGCPVPASIGPYVKRLLDEAGIPASSIYRGSDPGATKILRRYGKHSQKQLWDASPAQRAAWGVTGTPNRPGGSMHELRSDGVAKRGPWGRRLDEWEQGVDAGPNTEANRERIRRAARRLGYQIYFPYDSVVEYHHFGFSLQPKPKNAVQRLHIIFERARMRLKR